MGRELIRVLYVEPRSMREVVWSMEWRGQELYLFNKRGSLTKRIPSESTQLFLDGLPFDHGVGRKIRYLGLLSE